MYNNVNVILALFQSLPADVNVISVFTSFPFSIVIKVFCLKSEYIRNMLHPMTYSL